MYLLFLSGFSETRIFLADYWKKAQILTIMKIRPVQGHLFHADRQTDRHYEANSHFSQFYESA